jgi:drug/metabolite transporter (DMT)-like permease
MSERVKVGAVYVLICLIWGTTWFAIKLGLDSFPPFFSAGLRFMVASAAYTLIVLVKKYPLPMDAHSVKLYLFIGLCSYVIPFGIIYWSEQYIASGLASVIFAIYPFSVAIWSKLFLKDEEIPPNKIIGMVIGFTGIVVLFSDALHFDMNMQFYGMLGAILNALIQSFVIVIVKKHGQKLHPVTVNFFPMLIGGIGLLILSLFVENVHALRFTPSGIGTILFLGIFGSVITFTSYYWLLRKINILLLSVISFITPVVAIYTGRFFLNETLTRNQLLGSIIALAGVLFSSLPKPKHLKLFNRN